MSLLVTMMTLSTMKIQLSDLSFLSFLSSQGSCFAEVADLCDYLAEDEKVFDCNQKSKFGQIYGREEKASTQLNFSDSGIGGWIPKFIIKQVKAGGTSALPCVPHRMAVPTENWLEQAVLG